MNKFDADIYLIIAIILTISLLIFNLLKVLKKLFDKLLKNKLLKFGKGVKRSIGKRTGVIRKSFITMNTRQRNKSLVYRYYQSMDKIIECLHLQDITNVESLLINILITSLIITLLITASLPKFLIFLVYIVLILTAHSILLFMSRMENISRFLSVMNAEGLICSYMEEGVVVAISKSIVHIDKRIKPIFIEFNMYMSGVNDANIEEALSILNMKIGPQFDRFCERALNHYKDGNNSIIAGFKDNIEKNTKRRILLKRQEENYKVSLFYYVVIIIACVIFTIVMSKMLGSGMAYFLTLHGRICTILSLCIALLGFVASQLIYSGGVE